MGRLLYTWATKFRGFNFRKWLLTREKRENKYLTKITNHAYSTLYNLLFVYIFVTVKLLSLFMSANECFISCNQFAIFTLTLFTGRTPNAAHSSKVVFEGSNALSTPKCACKKDEYININVHCHCC